MQYNIWINATTIVLSASSGGTSTGMFYICDFNTISTDADIVFHISLMYVYGIHPPLQPTATTNTHTHSTHREKKTVN